MVNNQPRGWATILRLLVGTILEVSLFVVVTVALYTLVDGDPFWTFLGNAILIVLVILMDTFEVWFWGSVIQHRRVPKFIRSWGRRYADFGSILAALYFFYGLVIVSNQIAIHYPHWPIWFAINPGGGVTHGDLASYFAATQFSLLLLVALDKGTRVINDEFKRRTSKTRASSDIDDDAATAVPADMPINHTAADFRKVLSKD